MVIEASAIDVQTVRLSAGVPAPGGPERRRTPRGTG
jgi:hypothetical protein